MATVTEPDRLAGGGALGGRTKAFLRTNATRHTQYVTGIVDVRAGRLLDVVQGLCERAANGMAGCGTEPKKPRLAGSFIVLDATADPSPIRCWWPTNTRPSPAAGLTR